MRQPKPTHEKRTAPTVAKQNSYHIWEYENRAYAFLPKAIKIHIPKNGYNY